MKDRNTKGKIRKVATRLLLIVCVFYWLVSVGGIVRGMPYDFIQEVHNIVPWTTFDINCIPLTENMVVSQVSRMDLETTKPIPIFWLKVLIITIISLVTVIIKIRRGKIKQDSEAVL